MAQRDLATDIWTQAADEIKRLHTEIIGHARQSLSNAIRIGEVLSQIKDVLKHGQFIEWLNENVPFNDRTARRYISCYERRDQLKTDNVSNLSEAYALLASSNSNGSGPQQLHESTFWTRNTKFGQSWWGGINQEFKDHPLETWRRDQVQSMAATLEPFAELYGRLKSLLND